MSYTYTAYPNAIVYGDEDYIDGTPENLTSLSFRKAVEVGIAREGDDLIAYAAYGEREGSVYVGSYDWAYVPVGGDGCEAAARQAVDELAKSIAEEWTRRFRREPWGDELYPHSADLIADDDAWPATLREGVTDEEIDDALGFTERAHDLFARALRELLGQYDELAKLDGDDDDDEYDDVELVPEANDEAVRRAAEVAKLYAGQ